MSNIEEYFQKYREDIVNFVEGKVRSQVKPTGDIYDTIANLIAKELPYGQGVDNAHAFLLTLLFPLFGVVGSRKQGLMLVIGTLIQTILKNIKTR